MEPLGTGIFCWTRGERVCNRYGAFFLAPSNIAETEHYPVSLDKPKLQLLNGLRVRITLEILESRQSGHLGDFALAIAPGAPPSVGTLIELGVGRLFLIDDEDYSLEEHPTQVEIGLAPSDGRDHFWLDPKVLYLLHDQSVALYIESTADPETPPSPLLEFPP